MCTFRFTQVRVKNNICNINIYVLRKHNCAFILTHLSIKCRFGQTAVQAGMQGHAFYQIGLQWG